MQPGNQWGWQEVLLNKANYLLETLAWQKSKDAQKKAPRNRPKPFVPDFMSRQEAKSPINNGSVAGTVDDIQSILDLPRG